VRFADRVADAGLPPVLLISPGWTYATGRGVGLQLSAPGSTCPNKPQPERTRAGPGPACPPLGAGAFIPDFMPRSDGRPGWPWHGSGMTENPSTSGTGTSLPGAPGPAAAGARPDPGPGWPRRAAVALIAALAGLSYAWQLGRDPLEPYYAAAVRSMSGSWHDFIFGAFDPAGTITLDKLPGAFWVQALSVHVFGYSTWAMILPQAVEGVVTVLVLYRAVSRLAGPVAGLIAALVLAVSPAVVALDRGNISDSLMIMLLVLAADAVSAAILSGGAWWRLIVAGVCVGLAFQAKMIEAWMVLPALGLAYLISGPGTTWRRVRQLVVAGLVAGLVSLSWMTAVSLVPAASRPYADGSNDNSLYAQVFTYNGFGRFGEQTPLQLLTGEIGPASVLQLAPAAPGPARLLENELGRDTGWLLPAALLAAVAGLAGLRRRPRGDPLRACVILWGTWLVTLWAEDSATTELNTYYTAALAPAAAALIGAGVAAAWSARSRPGLAPRLALAVVVAGTAAYAAWLVPPAGRDVPGWLVPAVIVAGVLATGAALASVAVRRDPVFATALGAGIAAGVLVPAVACAGLVASHESAFDTPFEPAQAVRAVDSLPELQAQVDQLIPNLELVQGRAPDLLATQSAAVAAFFAASGEEVLPIGGFTGTIPSPTLSQLQADIRAGQFHLVLANSTADPRIAWIAAHCQNVTKPGDSLKSYLCLPASAGG
jgi:4-amino-4-deoxy-L-arabinose transferase-like glycosyltransferase